MLTLEQAILDNHLEHVKQLLACTPEAINEPSSSNMLLPNLAALHGHEEIFRYITEYSRFSFDRKDTFHRTPLHYAVQSGNLSLVQYITEKLAMSPLDGDCNLITPLDLAISCNYVEIQFYFEMKLGCSYEDLYRNPILTGMHPDPSIVRVGKDYYMVHSSFIYFPCIPISHSRDLIHWEVIGHAITNPEWAALQELEGGRGFWAPDISYHNGRFYITATYRLNDTGTVYRRQMIVSSEQPQGPYTQPAWIEEDGIDPSLFTDDDGKRYMLLNRGARILELNQEATQQISKASLLFYGDHKRAPEGPHLLKKDGYYYLFLAEGGTGTGHRITVARSTNLFGTYEPCPYNPILHESDLSAPIVRCGHGKPVMTQKGEWFMVYLCARMLKGSYTVLGRETALDSITWTKDGWPIVNRNGKPAVLSKRPNLPNTPLPDQTPWQYSFEWVSPRAPEPYGIVKSEKGITITSSASPLSSIAARNLCLRRQTLFHFTYSAVINVPELKSGQQAGLTCYYDENTYLTYSLIYKDMNYYLQVVEHIDANDFVRYEQEIIFIKESKLQLIIETNGLSRSFYYVLDQASKLKVGTCEYVNYLCDEGIKKGKRFTGAMFGFYAYSKCEPFDVTFTDYCMTEC